MPYIVGSFINSSIDLLLGNIPNFLGTVVQKRRQFPCNLVSAFRNGRSWRRGDVADLFVSPERSAEQLLDGRLRGWRQVASLLN